MMEKLIQKIKWAANLAKTAFFITISGAMLLIASPVLVIAETLNKLALVANALGGVLVNTWKDRD